MLRLETKQTIAVSLALLAAASPSTAIGQVKTTVPDIVAGARPAVVERITIQGRALEGNLEGHTADRTALIFLPPIIDDGVSKRLALKKGANLIRGSIVNAGGATDFCARFLDKNGRPVTGLSVSLMDQSRQPE